MSGIGAIASMMRPDSAAAMLRAADGARRPGSFASHLQAAATKPMRLERAGDEPARAWRFGEAAPAMRLGPQLAPELQFDRGIQKSMSMSQRPAVDDDELRDSARKLVASALLMPLLEQMESSPFRPDSGPFSRTVVEKRFGPLMHQNMADRMMSGRSFGLVESVMARMKGASGVDAGTMEIRA